MADDMHIQRTFPQRIVDTLRRVPLSVLNQSPSPTPADMPDMDHALKQHTNRMKAEAVHPHTGQIDYVQLRSSETYHSYRTLTTQLQTFNLHDLIPYPRKVAFWLNLYNALVIDAIIYYGVRRSVNEVSGFFNRAAYNIGGYRFSLDDIEHGILRANVGHPVIPGPQFGPDDPRRRFAADYIDHRIHFALVCGAKSCPPINFYDADRIEPQLDLAAQSFITQDIEVDSTTITASKILQWYGADFGAGRWSATGYGNHRALIQTITPYIMDAQKCATIESIGEKARLRFRSYDWSLNILATPSGL